MFENAGEVAGLVWNALNESAPLSAKDLKEAAKVKTDKELYLALGWLLREDKLVVGGTAKEHVFSFANKILKFFSQYMLYRGRMNPLMIRNILLK